MIRFFFLIIICSTLIACNKQEEDVAKLIPEGVLEEDKMIQVMMDLQMAESYIRNNRHNIDSIQPKAFYDWVWEQNSTSKAQVKKSLEHYINYPGKMEEMYLEVINRLTETQAKLEAEMEKNNEG